MVVKQTKETRKAIIEASGSLGSAKETSTGKYRIRIIEGDRWGSSGYYPSAVIERDGPRVFASGTQMFLDHPTFTEENLDRPERSVRDLVGIISGDPEWNEKDAALEADVQFFSQYANMIKEIAPHVGISINAYATIEHGDIGGEFGEIITSLIEAKSVDVVTKAGAGGAIVSAIESATGRKASGENAAGKRSGQQQKESAVADTTVNAETLDALTKAMSSLTEALNGDQKEREELKAAAVAAAESVKPDPLDIALAVAEAKLPKSYAGRVIEAVKNDVEVSVAIADAKTELAEVLKEAGVKESDTKPTTRIGAPAENGASSTANTVSAGSYGNVDISESYIEKMLGQLSGAKGN